MTKKEQWQKFSALVEDHIDNYVVPKYGEKPIEMDKFNIGSEIIRYAARIGRGDKRDALKIAHYACYLLEKL
jgi:hypothetical protein